MENYNAPTPQNKLKFPFAAIFFLLQAAHLLWYFLQNMRALSYNSYASIQILTQITVIIIYVYVAVALLFRKRGGLLISAVLALFATPVIYIIRYLWISLANDFTDSAELLKMAVGALPYLLLVVLVLYCNSKKDAAIGALANLWFIPGVIAVLHFLTQNRGLLAFLRYRSIALEFIRFYIIPGVLEVVGIFLLGYWISYIYSADKKTVRPVYYNYNYNYNATPIPPTPGQPVSGQTTPAQHRFCGACGAPVAPQNAFCPACGSNLSQQMNG